MKCRMAWSHLDFKKGGYAPCYRFKNYAGYWDHSSDDKLPSQVINNSIFNLSDNNSITLNDFLNDYKKIISKKNLDLYIHSKLVSSIWKIKRDNAKLSIFSLNFLLYIANKIFKYTLNEKQTIKWLDFFKSIENIRRPN